MVYVKNVLQINCLNSNFLINNKIKKCNNDKKQFIFIYYFDF